MLLPLDAANSREIDALLDAAFGANRRTRTAYQLRDGVSILAAMSFCVTDDADILIGSIQCWPVKITDELGEDYPLVLVGPVAVAPDHQGEGLGQMLMHAALNAAMMEGNPPLIMIGDPEYYARFGFSAAETGGWQLPGPCEVHRLLLRNEGDYPLPTAGMIAPDLGN